MSIYTRMAAVVIDKLETYGFDVVLQQLNSDYSDWGEQTDSWGDVATIKAVWDLEGSVSDGLKNNSVGSEAKYQMYIEYRNDLKSTQAAGKYRISYNGNYYGIRGAHVIGDQVMIRLSLDDGIPA